MNHHFQVSTANHILEQILSYAQKGFTGKIEIEIGDQHKTAFYFNLGFLAWGTDGIKSYRRSTRHLIKLGISSEIAVAILYQEKQTQSLNCEEEGSFVAEEYNTLVTLIKDGLLTKKQIQTLISNYCQELLFDLISQLEHNRTQRQDWQINVYLGERPSRSSLIPHTWLCAFDLVLQHTREFYQKWIALEIPNCSPNQVPVIQHHKRLSDKTNPKTYEKLVSLLNKKYTLREIAVQTKQDVLSIITPLAPLIKEGTIILQSLPEKSSPKTTTKQAHSKLKIIAIDDNRQTLRILEGIVKNGGNDFTGISNPMTALPQLIETKPDLIFLDLIMPVFNGYELCRKIRKVEALSNVPIIILSGKLIDKVRAKLAGATSSLQKPIVCQQVEEAIKIYSEKKKESALVSEPSRDLIMEGS
ncbi:response regulator receiver protein [Halothece sp. PCC 7418]|uniref:response regulator n=1 Tax=Halothece sp. (strain PCC 7418) TaxID=65093 RepID=UPI0002A086FD|nr:response regulator [Halothece sp. PCC 7418]AFZ45638.1 response regulator receiver protein [Halothece sp. PCC 7418]